MTVPRQEPGGRRLRSRIAASSPLSGGGHMWYASKRPLQQRRTATRSRGSAQNGAIIKTKGGASRTLPDHKAKPRRWRDAVSEFRAGLAAKHYLTVLLTPARDTTQPEKAFFRSGEILPPAAPGQASDEAMTDQLQRAPDGPAATPPPGDAPAFDSERCTNARDARLELRDPAARSSAARYRCQTEKGRCHTLTACSP